MKIFLLIAFGQLISLIGSHMTGFALGLRIYEQEQSVTLFALVSFATLMPEIVLGAFLGPLIDRWNRRTILIVGNLGAGIGTLFLIYLNTYHELNVFYIICLVALSSSFNALIFPAFMAATTSLVKSEKLGQANGLVQLGAAISQIAAPAIAGFVVTFWGLSGVLIIDVCTFSFAVVLLSLIKIPDHKATHRAEHQTVQDSFKKQFLEGWTYLKEEKGLLWLLGFFAVANFNLGMVIVLFTPLVLSFTHAADLGMVMSIAGTGMLLGALIMSLWGGMNSKISMIFIFLGLQGVLFLLAILPLSFTLVSIVAFSVMFTIPLINTSNQVIWQRKVPSSLQGRVFSLRTSIGSAFLPLAFLLAGPLADQFFEPMMAVDGVLAQTFGQIMGTGEGRGIALQLVILGSLTLSLVFIGYRQPQLRLIETKQIELKLVKHSSEYKNTIRQAKKKFKKLKELSLRSDSLTQQIGFLRTLDPFVLEKMILLALQQNNQSVDIDNRCVWINGQKTLIQVKAYRGEVNKKHLNLFKALCELKDSKGWFFHSGKSELNNYQDEIEIFSGKKLLNLLNGKTTDFVV